VRRYSDHHPQPDEIALLIEIAETSLARDRLKISLYAEAGIRECWIVNLIDEQIEVYSDPLTASATYHVRTIWLPGNAVPLNLDGNAIATISVDDLLP
jgi:Uma2 family endonuclease